MNIPKEEQTATIILFNDPSNKKFSHRSSFKKILGTDKLKCYQRYGPQSGIVNILLGAITAHANSDSITKWLHDPQLNCTHVISVPANVKRNEILDLIFAENIIGSFTTSIAELGKLELLLYKYNEALFIRRSPQLWINMAERNLETLKENSLIDASITNFKLEIFERLKPVYGLDALKQSQAEVSQWIYEHRWQYID